MCNQLENLLGKLDKIYAKCLIKIKPEGFTEGFVDLSDSRSYHRDLIKQYRHSKNFCKQTSRVAFTSSGKNDSNRKVIDNDKDASNAKGETVEVSSQKPATNKQKQELSVAKLVETTYIRSNWTWKTHG